MEDFGNLIPKTVEGCKQNLEGHPCFNVFFFFFLVFQDRVSLYSPGCPGAHFVDQAGPDLRNPACLCLLSAGIKGVHHHARLLMYFFKDLFFIYFIYVNTMSLSSDTPEEGIRSHYR
jgi:hypothetical protein